MPLEALKQRFMAMAIIDIVCAALALAAFIGETRTGQAWMLWVFYGLLAVAVGAQVWFILGFRKGPTNG